MKNRQITEQDAQIISLKQNIDKLKQVITALHNSKSWKITSPLRFVSAQIKKFFQKRQQIKQAAPDETQADNNLPKDFNTEVYLKLNPDLRIPGLDLKAHYLHHGCYEGRPFLLPALNTIKGSNKFKPGLETVLIVSHEASLTGAPILSLNLVQQLASRYNLVVLLLGEGPLINAFKQAGAVEVVIAPSAMENPNYSDLVIYQLCKRFNFKFSIVNSIVSWGVLPSLCHHFIPTISLFHEFASYTRPRYRFREAIYWSSNVVFSTKLTSENTKAEYPDLRDRNFNIIPQGQCTVPTEAFDAAKVKTDRERIQTGMRPVNMDKDAVIILGAGACHLRKGIELFLECATRVISTPNGKKCRFVWIGTGFDPDNDLSYSVYIADQIRRANLEQHVSFLDQTCSIDTAYEDADLFLLSSRLDPLPNVAIDAMIHGLPIVCFDKTTGIANFLNDNGLADHCVVNYLDSAEMAKKVLALADSQDLRKQIGNQCREAATAQFRMKDYVARIENLVQDACNLTQQEKADTRVIADSGLFQPNFSCTPYMFGNTIEERVREYVRCWASEIGARKPFPGFHPGIYQDQHGLTTQGADPFADYLLAGQPDGPWNNQVITAEKNKDKKLQNNKNIALHLHIYYPELLPEITTRLCKNKLCPDLFVSVTDEEARKLVTNQLKNYKGKIVDIQVVPNRGRDIAPFLITFGQKFLNNYNFIGHIHTKKSIQVKETSMGKVWYQFLLENLLGGELSGAMMDNIINRMNNDASIGMVFPDDPNIVGWCANRPFAEPIATRLGLKKLPKSFIFPVGSMFWVKTSALAPLINLKLDWNDFPEEPLPYDGTSLHAIERLFALTLSLNNLRSVTTYTNGVTR